MRGSGGGDREDWVWRGLGVEGRRRGLGLEGLERGWNGREVERIGGWRECMLFGIAVYCPVGFI